MTRRRTAFLEVVVIGLLAGSASRCAAAESDASRQVPPIVIHVLTPIRSSTDFTLAYWAKGLKDLDPNVVSLDLEIRSADNAKLVALVPAMPHYYFEKLWTGRLPAGKYVAALAAKGIRVSNPAEFTVDPEFTTGSAPTLALTALPAPPGAAAPFLGLTVTGPTPEDPKLTNMETTWPALVVDGTAYKAGPGA